MPEQLLLQRPRVFSDSQLEQMEGAACRILAEVGIAVSHRGLRDRLSARGFSAEGERIRIPADGVARFLEDEREGCGGSPGFGPETVSPPGERISLSVSPYPQNVHDLDTGEIRPFDTTGLIQATKLVEGLAAEGVRAQVPGCPTDVAPALQPVVQYWVSATYARHGRRPVDPKSEATVPYVRAMAEALGESLDRLPVYVFSPLSLRGESLQCVLAAGDALAAVEVSDMTSLGCTTPIHVGDAFAFCAAEVIGSAMLVRALAEHVRVSWHIRICPADLRHMTMVLGSAEDFWLQLANAEVNAFFHGTPWSPAVTGMHTSAKLPGAQACTEKASMMTAGALLGARHFGVAGTLSLDEVFSPEQLLYDVELRDHVQQMVRLPDVECDADRCLRDVCEAVETHGFTALNSTLQTYRDVYWHPALFERRFLSAWQCAGAETIAQRAKRRVEELVGGHDYGLDREVQRELDRVLADARRRLG